MEQMSAAIFTDSVVEQFEVSFAAVGVGPSKPEDERIFAELMERDYAVRQGDFLIHLGSVMEHAPPELRYERLSELLQNQRGRTFVLPGKTEVESKQRALWAKHFRSPADEWKGDRRPLSPLDTAEGEGRQAIHPDNFAFERGGVLFVGIDLPCGDPDSEAFEAQLERADRWLLACFSSAKAWARAAVIFAHAFPSAHHQRFVRSLRSAARRFDRPILYLHTDSYYLPTDRPHTTGPSHTHLRTDEHHWLKDNPWPERNITRVQVDGVAEAAPLLVRVRLDGDELIEFDRQYFRGPYLTCGTHESIAIQWRTGRQIDPIVKVGLAPGEWAWSYSGSDIERKQAAGSGATRLHSGPFDAHQYSVVVKGLEPATRYYYAIYDQDRLIAGGDGEHYFTTSPEPGARVPIRFWAVGDSGKGNQAQADVHNAMLEKARADGKPIDLFLHLGDMAYSSGTDAEFQKHFFLPYRQTLRHVVLWPTMSNHEGVTSDGESDIGPYYDAFRLPIEGEAGGIGSGTLSYFGFDYGNVHFICLCSYGIDLGPEGRQAQWLRENLRRVREEGKADWIVVYFHHPPYSKGTHDSDTESGLIDVRHHVMPILEEGGVDLVLNGHSHTYERTMLIDGLYETPMIIEEKVIDDGDGDPDGDGPYRKSAGINPHEGVVAVVCGCGGANLGRIGTAPPMKTVVVEYGSLIVDVDGDTLTAVMLDRDGVVRDRFAIQKRGRVSASRAKNPRLLSPYHNYRRVTALAALSKAPDLGEEVRATVQFRRVPKACEAELVWECDGTAWEISPPIDRFWLQEGHETERTFSFARSGPTFPIPTGKVILTRDASDQHVRPVELHLPPWRRVAVRRMTVRPIVDGVIDREALDGLDRGGEFVKFQGTGSAAAATEFYIGRWSDKLYVAVINHQPREIERLHVSSPQAEQARPWDDTCEVYLSLPESRDVFQFLLNARGQRLDAKNGWGQRSLAWSGEWESGARIETDRWCAEFLIDLSALGSPLAAGQTIRLNVCRNNAVEREYTQWSYSNQKKPHIREHFGFGTVE